MDVGTLMRVLCEPNYWTSCFIGAQHLNSTGIGPEAFAYNSTKGNFTGSWDSLISLARHLCMTAGLGAPTAYQVSFFEEHGFYVTTPYYILRPEVLESNFYGWRVTGDTKYLDRAASAISSIQKYLPGNVAFDGIWDVTIVDSDKMDDMESFWFAEVLKYLYVYVFFLMLVLATDRTPGI